MTRALIILSTLLLICGTALPVAAQERAPKALSGVPRVVDGETLAIGDSRFRVDGIDAPEKAQACYLRANDSTSAWACGQAAGQALTDLIAGQQVTCWSSKTDRYGRFIAKCSVLVENRAVDLGGAMVWNGWALAYTQYSKDYVIEQDMAKAAARGIWGSRWQSPADYRRGNSQDGQ